MVNDTIKSFKDLNFTREGVLHTYIGGGWYYRDDPDCGWGRADELQLVVEESDPMAKPQLEFDFGN